MERIKNYKLFVEQTTINSAYEEVNENIFNFLQNKDIDAEEIKKKQNDILSKYDLPQSDIDNIKSKISDAISKKSVDFSIKNINVDNK